MLRAAVNRVALAHPTYGYRRVQRELTSSDITIGLNKVRRVLRELNLIPEPHRARRSRSRFIPEVEYPPGRRVQIDATQVKLANSRSWVNLVQDVTSRALLEIHATRALSKYTATEVLRRAIDRLRSQGITEPVTIQSDGESEFTSNAFQEYCQEVGTWIRSKVSVKGGLGYWNGSTERSSTISA
ncbi:MAG: transposase [Trueperaceae bacterium]|nr:MAG: transposase [Trueperaceae bacterium]